MRALLALLVACGSTPKRDPDQTIPTNASVEETTTAKPLSNPGGGDAEGMKCMPLIGCGCFMQCSMGPWDPPEGDEYKVEYYDTMVMAKIEKYCVGGTCTDVWAVHTCAKECTPAPLTAKCEFERGAFVKCKDKS
jgi:hypothetical protein